MVTTKYNFAEHFVKNLNSHLYNNLPQDETTIKMLLRTQELTNSYIEHIITAMTEYPEAAEQINTQNFSR